ncbi:hypothetical protein R3I93_007361 [Phoxinus phoxinus]|uniref:Uncharacterized protein n=1 Tax=Phoxinus phoxinus TaxID=58324 RepID=A0AAN9D910_9TELE
MSGPWGLFSHCAPLLLILKQTNLTVKAASSHESVD